MSYFIRYKIYFCLIINKICLKRKKHSRNKIKRYIYIIVQNKQQMETVYIVNAILSFYTWSIESEGNKDEEYE